MRALVVDAATPTAFEHDVVLVAYERFSGKTVEVDTPGASALEHGLRRVADEGWFAVAYLHGDFGDGE